MQTVITEATNAYSLHKMTTIEQIKAEIEELSEQDFVRLREWFAQKDWLLWDEQIKTDADSGKLDFLIEEAMSAKREGTLQDL